MSKKITFTEEIKRKVVELSFNSEKTAKEAAKDLDINYSNIARWRKKYKNKCNNKSQNVRNQILTSKEKKIKKLENELRETKLERDILKKAVGIFSNKRNNL